MRTSTSAGRKASAGSLVTVAVFAVTFCFGCVHHHYHDDDHVVIIDDDRGYHHEGYYDRDRGWHGGYYDEHRGYHDDDRGWHR